MTPEQSVLAIVCGTVASLVMGVFLFSRAMVKRYKRIQLARLGPAEPRYSFDEVLPPPPPEGIRDQVDVGFQRLVTGTGWDLSTEQAAGIIGLCGIGAAAGLFLWRQELWLAFAGMIVGLAIPIALFVLTSGRRRRQIQDQLPDAIYFLARSLRAGLSMEQSLEIAARETPTPLQDEMKRMSEQVKLGLALPIAVQGAAERVGGADFGAFSAAVTLHRSTGGPLPNILDKVANSIRDRNQYLGQFRAATALGRISAVAIGLAVPALFVYYILFQPETVQKFLETPGGISMLAVAFGLEIVGIIWIWKLLQVEE